MCCKALDSCQPTTSPWCYVWWLRWTPPRCRRRIALPLSQWYYHPRPAWWCLVWQREVWALRNRGLWYGGWKWQNDYMVEHWFPSVPADVNGVSSSVCGKTYMQWLQRILHQVDSSEQPQSYSDCKDLYLMDITHQVSKEQQCFREIIWSSIANLAFTFWNRNRNRNESNQFWFGYTYIGIQKKSFRSREADWYSLWCHLRRTCPSPHLHPYSPLSRTNLVSSSEEIIILWTETELPVWCSRS